MAVKANGLWDLVHKYYLGQKMWNPKFIIMCIIICHFCENISTVSWIFSDHNLHTFWISRCWVRFSTFSSKFTDLNFLYKFTVQTVILLPQKTLKISSTVSLVPFWSNNMTQLNILAFQTKPWGTSYDRDFVTNET